MRLFRFGNKRLRALAIRRYMEEHGYGRAVCFSCGNASRELREAGVDVLDVSPEGDLLALRWFTIGEIAERFPGYFDATSGHLPMDCMAMVAGEYRAALGPLEGGICLPTGSGETLVCLKMAYPDLRVTAVYGLDDATEYGPEAPLNWLVRALADEVVFADGRHEGR